jgi:hypothetical protein
MAGLDTKSGPDTKQLGSLPESDMHGGGPRYEVGHRCEAAGFACPSRTRMTAGPDTKSGIDTKRLGSRARVGHAWRRTRIPGGWVRVPEPDTHDGGPRHEVGP